MIDTQWIKKELKYGACNVEKNFDFYFNFLLSKLHEIFVWENLPETIDEVWLNNNLFVNGLICFTDFNGELYALNGNQGGIDKYYYSEWFTIANPVLGEKRAYIGKNCVMMYNSPSDKYFPQGLYQLITIMATMLADNIVSINTAQINTRVQAIVTADSTAERNSAETYLKRLYAGEPYSVVEETLVNKIGVNPINKTNTDITDLIELQQYILGTFFQSIGVKLNSVSKKERLISDEINSVDSYLKISLDSMLKSRQKAVNDINTMFGTNISVRINPAVDYEKQEEEAAQEEQAEESGVNDNDAES